MYSTYQISANTGLHLDAL